MTDQEDRNNNKKPASDIEDAETLDTQTEIPSDEREAPDNEPQNPVTDDAELDEVVQQQTDSEPSQDEHNLGDVTQDVPEDQGPDTPVPTQVPTGELKTKRGGRGLGILATLIALMALAGVGYLYYELVYLKPLKAVESAGAVLRADYDKLSRDVAAQISALEKSTKETVDRVQQEQVERLANNEEAVVKSLNEALVAAPPSQREWKLAEAEYLLRIANHRVLMAQDSIGALSLLQAADQIMTDLDDFSLHQVRALLADEIIALRQVPREDLQGVYLRLEAIKSQLNNLPLPEPTFVNKADPVSGEQSGWQVLLDELKSFIRVRPLSGDEVLKPLLAPEEIKYLSLNLRLSLEQSQLAALKRQQDVYEQSLLNVRRWLVDHVDVKDPRTQAVLNSVDELMLIKLAQPMPDISKSLNELLSIRRSAS